MLMGKVNSTKIGLIKRLRTPRIITTTNAVEKDSKVNPGTNFAVAKIMSARSNHSRSNFMLVILYH